MLCLPILFDGMKRRHETAVRFKPQAKYGSGKVAVHCEPVINVKRVFLALSPTTLTVIDCCCCGYPLIFLEMEAGLETIFQIHAANIIKLGWGKVAAHFEPVMNANYRLVAPPPTRRTAIFMCPELPLATCWLSSFTILPR